MKTTSYLLVCWSCIQRKMEHTVHFWALKVLCVVEVVNIEGVEAVSCGSIAPRLLVFPPAGQEGAAADEVPQRL